MWNTSAKFWITPKLEKQKEKQKINNRINFENNKFYLNGFIKFPFSSAKCLYRNIFILSFVVNAINTALNIKLLLDLVKK